MDDLISREEALKILRDEIKSALRNGQPQSYVDGLACASLMLEDYIESAEAVPVVHGRWIEYPTEIMCSVCGAKYNDDIVCTPSNMNGGRYAGLEHCPHCGAKMDGGMANGEG